MLAELKSNQYKQQVTFSYSEINSIAASLFSNVFLLSSFHSSNRKQQRAEENAIKMGLKKNKIKEESKKKSKEPKNAQRWTDVELDAYADVLADPENSFAATLDKLALKKSSYKEVFEHIQKELAAEMETEDFQSRNNDYFKNTPTKLDISIEKLRQKYKWFKTEWTNKTNRAKNGSGADPEKESHWYQILNSVFAEMNKPLNLESSAAETSFVNENFSDSSLEEHDNDDDDESEPASFSRSDGTNLNDLDAEDKQADNDAPRGIHQNVRQADKPPLRIKSEIVKPPNKKSEQIKSTTHGLSRGIKASMAAQYWTFEC